MQPAAIGSEINFVNLFDKILDAIIIVDYFKRIIYANAKAEEILGLNRDDLIKKKITEILIGIEESCIFPNSFEDEKGRAIQSFEMKLDSSNRQKRFLAVKKFPILEGSILHILDQTEKKEIERQLNDSLEKYWLITENANDLIAVLNSKTEYEYVNGETYRNLLGYSKEAILGKRPLEFIHPDDREEAMKVFLKGCETGEGVMELRLRHKNGNYLWFEAKGQIFIDKDGNQKALIISRDITEKKLAKDAMAKLLDEFKRQNKKLKQLDKIKDEMLNTVAHELRTPLVSILGFMELFTQDISNLTPQQLQYLIILERNVHRLNRQIEQILSLGKLEMGKIKLDIETIDVRQLLESVLEELSFQIKQKFHNIYLKIPPNFKIQADLDRIHQIFSNLLSNAIKYTPARGKIEIEVKKYGLKALFSIKDTGIGIKKNQLPRVFEKFTTFERRDAKAIGDVKGFGLGLNITKQIIELHGGKIWVESEGVNKGTTFFFEIPISY